MRTCFAKAAGSFAAAGNVVQSGAGVAVGATVAGAGISVALGAALARDVSVEVLAGADAAIC